MFYASCGIHRNKKLIDTTHISLVGFCLCKHHNTECVSYGAFHREIWSLIVCWSIRIKALPRSIALVLSSTICSVTFEQFVSSATQNDRSSFFPSQVKSPLTAVLEARKIIPKEIYPATFIIDLLANNCNAFRYYSSRYPLGISFLFIAFVFVWNCWLRKLPIVK